MVSVVLTGRIRNDIHQCGRPYISSWWLASIPPKKAPHSSMSHSSSLKGGQGLSASPFSWGTIHRLKATILLPLAVSSATNERS